MLGTVRIGYGKLAHMVNWPMWQNNFGEQAYRKQENGATTSYPISQLLDKIEKSGW